MLKAWEQRNEWSNIRNIEAWLTQICKNLALDRKKRAAHTILPLIQSVPTQASKEPENVLGQAPSPHQTAELNESIQILSRLINQLPPPQADIVRLRDIEGLSYADIASQLNLTDAQVRVYLHRARTKIREEYMKIYKDQP